MMFWRKRVYLATLSVDGAPISVVTNERAGYTLSNMAARFPNAPVALVGYWPITKAESLELGNSFQDRKVS
jgi:hypothetical protein